MTIGRAEHVIAQHWRQCPACADGLAQVLERYPGWRPGLAAPVGPQETLAAVDAAVEGRCAGPNCSQVLTEQSASAYWCSATCQAIWQLQQAGRPSPGSAPVRGSEEVDASHMRWRPDLVSAFDDAGLTLLDRHGRGDTGLDYCVFTRESDMDMAHLRVDDGYRFVGMDVPWAELEAAGPSEPFRRLERELGDQRRIDPEPGRSEPATIMRVGDRVYDERDRPALIAWLCANGLVPEDVPAGQTVSIDGDTLTLDCFTRDTEGNLRMDDSRENFLAQPVRVPLVEPPPEPRSDLLRRMGEAFDREVLGREGERAVLSGQPDPRAGGTVFWLPDRPADPAAPTAAELERGIDLTPYLAPAEYADGQRMESHVCRWEVSFETGYYRCGLHWSDGVRCESRTDDRASVRRTERLVGPRATGRR